MKLEEVKRSLNKRVNYKDNFNGIDSEYILTACIIRKNSKGYYYQVELNDIKANSIINANLDSIDKIT